MPLPIGSYELPGNKSVPQYLVEKYRIGGFDEALRSWHIDRLPRYQIPQTTLIVCPWCGKMRDKRSLQIDHIIPIQQYERYKFWVEFSKGKVSTSQSNQMARQFYNDENNLALSCMKCNVKKKDHMPSEEDLRQAKEYCAGHDITQALDAALEVVTGISLLSAPVAKWVYSGIPPNKKRPVSGPIRNKNIAPSHKFNPLGTSGDKKPVVSEQVQKRIDEVQWIVTYFLKGTRVLGWNGVTIDGLWGRQPARQLQYDLGRLCFYCMGLFKKQAFQIDHIHPSSNRKETIANYNEPRNLIPVCRTCNTGKGNRSLSEQWLNDRIRQRQLENLPGYEHVEHLGLGLEPIEHFKQHRVRILGW